MHHPLAPLDYGGMVLVLAFEDSAGADVAKLRVRTQQLLATDRRLGREQPRAGHAEERVRNLLRQGRSERLVLRIELVDVDGGVIAPAEAQVIAARAGVTDCDRLVTWQLTLEVHGELLYAGRGAVLIDVGDVGAGAGHGAKAVPQ